MGVAMFALVVAALLLAMTYALERYDHRQRTGRVGWACENAQCSCRGSLDDLVVTRRPMARKRYDPTGRPWGRGW